MEATNNNPTTVTMTAEERAEYEAFRADRARRAEAERLRSERQAYAQMVDDCVTRAIPALQNISATLAHTKRTVIEQFRTAIELKSELFRKQVKPDQRSHTFTNSEGTARITLGVYTLDGYRDTVNDGIDMVKEYLASLAKDDDSTALVNAVLRLMSKDQMGNLKASRVLQLRKMANESGNERFIEGVRIIEESYQPVQSKQFIRAEIRTEEGEWKPVPLGMTEA